VRWNGSQLAARINSPTQLQVQIAPSLIATPGNARITVVNPGGVASQEYNLPIEAAPAIGSLNPNSATAGAGVNLTVNGSGFQTGAVLEFNKSQLQPNVTGATQLRVAVPASLVSPPGQVNVVVINPGNIRSAAATFTVNPAPVVVPPPAISGLNPVSAAAGGDKFELTVSGSGFAQGASLHWNTSALTPLSGGNATQLRVTVPAEFIVRQIPVTVTVVNPDKQSSNALPFTINPPAVAQPAITSLNPNSTPAGGPAFTLIVNGSGFQQGATVRWEGSGLDTTFVGPNQLRARVLQFRIAAPGTAAITMVNPGTLPSAPMTFTILPPQGARPDPNVELVKSVLTEYATAYSAKDFDRVEALYPSMPATDKNTLKRFFKDVNYTVSYTIEFDQPVIKGDEATVNARTVVTQSYRRQKQPPVTKNVAVTLHKGGGQWTISVIQIH
jgi:hypothetical protein